MPMAMAMKMRMKMITGGAKQGGIEQLLFQAVAFIGNRITNARDNSINPKIPVAIQFENPGALKCL